MIVSEIKNFFSSSFILIMQISLFTQYYIRKLLRHHISQLGTHQSDNNQLNSKQSDSRQLNVSIAQRRNFDAYFQTDLNQILGQLCLSKSEFAVKVRQIETLVCFHKNSDTGVCLHKSGDTGTEDCENLWEIEQQILELVGVKLHSAPSPSIVQEQTDSLFRFFLEGKIREGIRHVNELYGLVQDAEAEYEPGAEQLIGSLSEQAIPFILTQSASRYRIWISLRSPSYLALLDRQKNSLPTPLLATATALKQS
jgi:hypothetical protein